MFKIYDEPDSPSKGGVFKIYDEPESPNERNPCPPLFLSRARLPESFWPMVLVKTHHASIVLANGGGGWLF